MSSLFNWNKRSLGIFNRKNMPCAVLQGGVFFGMSIAATQALIDPKASLWEISNALATLTLTYGALGEQPYLWSFLLFLIVGTKARGQNISSTFPKELVLTTSMLHLLGIITPWFRLSDGDINDVGDTKGTTDPINKI